MMQQNPDVLFCPVGLYKKHCNLYTFTFYVKRAVCSHMWEFAAFMFDNLDLENGIVLFVMFSNLEKTINSLGKKQGD